MAKYKYMIQGVGYGGELVVGTTNEQFVRHWAPIVDDDGDSDLVEYLTDWDSEDLPEDALEDPNTPPSPGTEDNEWSAGSWHDLDDLEHVNSTFADSYYTVVELDENDEEVGEEQRYELSDAYSFYSRECYFNNGNDDKDAEEIPVVAVFSSEKGGFWNVKLELDEPFDPRLFTVGTLESELCELTDAIFYNGEQLDMEYDFADTYGKGMYAAVGWLNPKYHDKVATGEMLSYGLDDWKDWLADETV